MIFKLFHCRAEFQVSSKVQENLRCVKLRQVKLRRLLKTPTKTGPTLYSWRVIKFLNLVNWKLNNFLINISKFENQNGIHVNVIAWRITTQYSFQQSRGENNILNIRAADSHDLLFNQKEIERPILPIRKTSLAYSRKSFHY